MTNAFASDLVWMATHDVGESVIGIAYVDGEDIYKIPKQGLRPLKPRLV